MQFFYTAEKGIAAKIIRLFSWWDFSHCGVIIAPGKTHEGYNIPTADGMLRIHDPVYFESIFKKDSRTGKTGVRGPYPVSKLYAWVGEEAQPILDWHDYSPHARWTTGPKGRSLCIQAVPPRPGQMRAALLKLVDATHTIKYAKYQTIVQQCLHQLIGWTSPQWLRSPDKWNCGETCARVLKPEIQMEGLHAGDKLFDTLTPKNIFQGIERYWRIEETACGKA